MIYIAVKNQSLIYLLISLNNQSKIRYQDLSRGRADFIVDKKIQ